MKRFSRSLIALCIGSFFVLMFDGCLFRDPGVELSGGYEAVAISPSSPMHLHYSSRLDGRTYSNWYACAYTEFNAEGTDYALSNPDAPYERLKLGSESEWRTACVEKNVNPAFWAPKLEDVTGFEWNDDWIIGSDQGGFFILNVKKHDIETWTDESEWRRQVAARTPLSPDDLISGRSPWHQTRPMGSYIAYLVFILGCGVFGWFRPIAHRGNESPIAKPPRY